MQYLPRLHKFFALGLTWFALAGGGLMAQTPASTSSSKIDLDAKGPIREAHSVKADAYYHYSLGHMYEEMAAAYGNRSDFVNKSIENYRLAMKEDPGASFLFEAIADLYRQSGRLRDAVVEAEAALKNNPNDLSARRVLGRIYAQQIGDSQSNHLDEGMLKQAIAQYEKITAVDSKDTESWIMLGRLYRIAQNATASESAFQKVLDQEPDNEEALGGLAMLYADTGDARKAAALFEKLTKKSPSVRAYALLAATYEQMQDYALAAQAYQQALQLEPNRTELKEGLAAALAMSNQLDESLKIYQELVQANPQNPKLYLQISRIYAQQQKFTEAQEANNKAKQLDSDDIDVQYNDVRILEAQSKYPEAIQVLKGIVAKTEQKSYNAIDKANRVKLLDELARLYVSAESYEEAVVVYRQLASLDPDIAPRAQAGIIDTYRLARNYSKAEQAAAAAEKQFPADRTILAVKAELLSDQNKIDDSVATLKKLLDGNKDHDQKTWINLAQTYEKGRKYSDMANALDQAEKLSDSPDDKNTVQFMRGVMYERQKKMDLAEAEFQKVLSSNPNNASALNYLGYMLAERNERLNEAQELIQKALNLEPNNYAYLDSLGWVYFHMNKLDKAEQELLRSLQSGKKDPTVHDHLGDVYFKQGKTKEAIAQWQTSLVQWDASSPSEREPEEIAKVQKKLEGARVRQAKEQAPRTRGNIN